MLSSPTAGRIGIIPGQGGVTEGLPVDEVEFGRYRLLSLLGEGGMGEVWRAHDAVTDRVVAIKLLPPKLSKDEDFQQRFRREAHAAARLNTPHVVPIYDYGEIDGRLFVSMRLIEGRDLAAVLAEGPLEPARAVRIVDQVARALHAAHKVRLIHRDIKPSNILLDDDDFAYLIDFGIARIADDTRVTKTGNTIGTFAYIAPERLDGRGDEDGRVDIYSLACVLYECLAGAPPFGGDTMARLVAAHLNAPPPRPSIARPEVPTQVDAVIATGMAKDPDQRYATTIELADAARNAVTVPMKTLPATEQAPIETPASPGPTPALADGQQPPNPWASTATQLDPESPAYDAPQFASPAPQGQRTLSAMPLSPAPPTPAKAGGLSRRTTIALAGGAVALVAVIAAAVGITGYLLRPHPPASQTPSAQPAPPLTPTAPPPPPPLRPDALPGLLLSPDQIAAAARAPAMTVTFTQDYLVTATISNPDCSGVVTVYDTHTFAGTGWSAVHGNQLLDKSGSVDGVAASQILVLLPSARDAEAFFTVAAQRWPACANQQFTVTQPNQAQSTTVVGSVSNTNGTLSAALTTHPGTRSLPCAHALTVANNVVIESAACFAGHPAAANAVVDIVHQIAAKVPTA